MALPIAAAATFEGAKSGDIVIAGGILATAGAIMAWCYQIGSSRLGVVDLFACEISTICRVCAIVELFPRTIAAYDDVKSKLEPETARAGAPASPSRPLDAISLRLDSKESYEPVFDNNTRDLQVLDASVVVNVTRYYTYFKAMRDSWRKAGRCTTDEQRLTALRDVIYMQFLAFESARAAVGELIEFEPNEVDSTMIILLSEIPALAFLLDGFPEDDLRYQRLSLRVGTYEKIVADIRRKIMSGNGDQWSKLKLTADDLVSRYERLLKDRLTILRL